MSIGGTGDRLIAIFRQKPHYIMGKQLQKLSKRAASKNFHVLAGTLRNYSNTFMAQDKKDKFNCD